jgi:histidinol-phosphate aminotransferase
MSLMTIARPDLQALRPYAAAVQVDGAVRLNANEMPWSPGGDTFRRPLNRYPEIRPARLRRALAERYGCAAENLIVTRGSSEGIDLLLRVLCRPGQDSMVTATPTFSMYQHYARIQGARLVECPVAKERDFAVDVDALLASCEDSTRAIFVCSPNNPTGNLLPLDDLIRLLDARADRSAIIVDEAYIEFAQQPSVAGLLPRYENLIVLRTLSKALACAGARCGSVLAAAPFIELLDAVQAPYAMATPVVEFVERALQAGNLTQADRFVQDIRHARDELQTSIATFPFVQKVWPSAANFFLIQVQDAERLLAHCSERGILLRYFGGDLADCVRITVGSAEENRRLLAAFAELAET